MSLTCSVCDHSKANLTVRESAVLPGTRLFVCQSCMDQRYEPRWALIMAGRMKGPESVKYWINGHRYVGDPISFKEVIV